MDVVPITRVVLIRHGESASNAGGWLSGQQSCGGLTALGVSQAEALRARLAADEDLRPDAVLVSTMRRAVETAEIIAAPTGLIPELRAELIERTPGEAEGLTKDQYADRYGKMPFSDWSEPISPGGESGHDFATRATTALDRVVEDHRDQTVWVVCHGGIIMVSAIERWPNQSTVGSRSAVTGPANAPVAGPANTSISEWHVDPNNGWCLSRYNDHSHLVT